MLWAVPIVYIELDSESAALFHDGPPSVSPKGVVHIGGRSTIAGELLALSCEPHLGVLIDLISDFPQGNFVQYGL